MAQTTVEPRPKQPSTNGASGVGPACQTLRIDEALSQEGSDAAHGLSAAEVASRRQKYGPNAFTAAKKTPGWLQFVRQYKDTMQIVLLVAGVISGLIVHQWGSALMLVLLTVVN